MHHNYKTEQRYKPHSKTQNNTFFCATHNRDNRYIAAKDPRHRRAKSAAGGTAAEDAWLFALRQEIEPFEIVWTKQEKQEKQKKKSGPPVVSSLHYC